MTTNQISYLKYQEDSRHNRVQEEQNADTVKAQLQQAEAASKNVTSNYITALSNQKQAEAAMNQANARWGELQYKYDTMPLYEREVSAKEVTAAASATTAAANQTNAETNAAKIPIEQQNADSNTLKSLIEGKRVQAYIQSVAEQATKNKLDQKRIENEMQQFLLNYGLAKDDLERKKLMDKFDRSMRIIEGFNSTVDTARKILGTIGNFNLPQKSMLRSAFSLPAGVSGR